jgi:hypothetical protein
VSHVKIAPQTDAILESLVKEMRGNENAERAAIEKRLKQEE